MRPSVKVIPFPEIENAYIVISGRESDTPNGVNKNMTFFYHNENVSVEWEPKNGPITTIYACSKHHPDAEEHWFYPYCTGYGNWSQLAVLTEGLPEAFITGNYKQLFEILKNWSE